MIEKRISFQMSEGEDMENPQSFTTLAGINYYILGLYNFLKSNFMVI